MRNVPTINWGSSPDFYGPRDYFRNTFILRKVKNLVPEGEILDFGCGCGNLTEQLAAAGYKVWAVDPSAASLEALLQKTKDNVTMTKLIKVIQGDYQQIAEMKKKFDVICCGEVLEHIPDDREALKAFFDFLKPGGTCIATVPARMKYWDVSDIWAGHQRRYEKNALRQLFSQVGFKVIRLYCFGPITFLWHKVIFLPTLKRLFFQTDRPGVPFGSTFSKSRRILFYRFLIPFLSYLFYVDILCSNLNLWNSYLVVAHKNIRVAGK